MDDKRKNSDAIPTLTQRTADRRGTQAPPVDRASDRNSDAELEYVDGTPTPTQRTAHSRRRAQATEAAHRTFDRKEGPELELDFIDSCFKIFSTVLVVAANGTLLLLIGNALLSYKHTDLVAAAKIGAVGGIFAAPIITILLVVLKALPRNYIADLLIAFLFDFGDIALGAMSGFIGVVVLHWFGANVHVNTDAVGVAWAGALGGVIGVWRRDLTTVLVD